MYRGCSTVFLCLLCWFCFTQEGSGSDHQICGYPEMGFVEITRTGKKIARFAVTVAASTQRRRQGLTHCRCLSPGTGMLFTYPDGRQRTFWMKDTPLELAIVFIATQGRITSIEYGEPGSLRYIVSAEDTQSVLEINYPESRLLAVGDIVRLRLVP